MKILYVTTISNTVNAFLIPHIKMLIDEGHKVDVAFNIVQEVKPQIIEIGCKIHEVPFQRTPYSKRNFEAYRIIKKIIFEEEYDIVHTHTPVASALVRLACKESRNARVFYTAHGFHFYKGAPIMNWLVYYPVERWLSRYTDTLITINSEDYSRAKASFKANRIEYIPGIGLNIDFYRNTTVDWKAKRNSIGLGEDSFVVLSVGSLDQNKNYRVIIEAIAKLGNPKIHYVICGDGPLDKYLKDLAENLGISSQVHFLGFRSDIAEICKICNVFAIPSLREGLGMAALEAMACGLPLVTSNLHGIMDYSVDGETGFISEPKDIDGFSNCINKLFANKNLSEKISLNNIKKVENYEMKKTITLLQKLYK